MTSIKLYQYQLPIRPPVTINGRSLSVRNGLILLRQGDQGEAWGEAAPLPGMSFESLSDVINAARRQAWNEHRSLQFAYDSLKLPRTCGSTPVVALLMGDLASLRHMIDGAGMLPHSAIKMKVARAGSLDDEIQIVRELRQAMRPDQTLRLDANRGWSFAEALRFGEGVRDCRIEYIEEPSDDPADFERLFASAGVAYALDETLRDTRDLAAYSNAEALIVKPTLMGSRTTWSHLTDYGIRLVFSSSFESGIGLLNVARLAQQFSPGTSVGLDTYGWLERDLVTPRWSFQNGEFEINGNWGIDLSLLVEVK